MRVLLRDLMIVTSTRLGGMCCACLVLFSSALFFPQGLAAADIVLLAPSDQGVYGSFQTAFKKQLTEQCKNRQALSICTRDDGSVRFESNLDNPQFDQDELVISLGTIAAEKLASHAEIDTRLFTLIPKAGYQRINTCCMKGRRKQRSAVYVDQPLEKQFILMTQLLPGIKRVGVLLGEASNGKRPELEMLAKRFGLELITEVVSDTGNLGSTLKSLAEKIDALVAVPDPVIYNESTIVSILLTTYHHKVPVIGYSRAMVNAGATAAVFTEVEQLASSVVSDVMNYFQEGDVAPPHFSAIFSVQVNRDVSRSLGLRPGSDQLLRKALGSAVQ